VHLRQAFVAHALRQACLLVAAAHQHEAERLPAHQAGSVQQRVQRIGLAHRCRHSPPPQPAARAAARAIAGPASTPAVPSHSSSVMPLGTMCELAQVQPVRGHVLVHAGQHGHHDIGIAVGVFLGALADLDEGCRGDMPASSTGQRPQVVHLVDQLALPCRARRRATQMSIG
jgi:hypothetical protein